MPVLWVLFLQFWLLFSLHPVLTKEIGEIREHDVITKAESDT